MLAYKPRVLALKIMITYYNLVVYKSLDFGTRSGVIFKQVIRFFAYFSEIELNNLR